MTLFEKLFSAASSNENLGDFLEKHIQDIQDYSNANYQSIVEHLDSIERFILLKYNILKNLDYTIGHNKAFITILLDLSERLNLNAAVPRIISILLDKDIIVGCRLKAALLYLYNIDCNSTLVERFEKICCELQYALENDEDDEKKVVATFLNYYSSVQINTPKEFGGKLNQRVNDAIYNKAYRFLQNPYILQAVAVSSEDSNVVFSSIKIIIDELLQKSRIVLDFISPKDELLIEFDTDYKQQLSLTVKEFQPIRNISVEEYRQLPNKDEAYNSLGRGVSIIQNESQMVAYMNSFGNAHQAKIQSAIEMIDFDEIRDDVEIIDWSCGQGLASMVLFDHLSSLEIDTEIKRVTLIEPSLICLKRAALHIRHYNSHTDLRTIYSDLDSLDWLNIQSEESRIKIHLFSNILDIDGFNMVNLLRKIEASNSGENYFICVSPYITDAKAERVESFNRHFRKNYDNYTLLGEYSNGGRFEDKYWNCNNAFRNCMCLDHPENCNGAKKWTRIIRVFRVNMS